MVEPLGTSLRDLFSPDPEHRHLLHQVVESVQLDQGLSYLEALERVHEAAETAINRGKPTLGEALKHARGDSDYLVDSLRLLDQRDRAVATVRDRESEALARERTDALGRVLLDQPESARRDDRPQSLDADGRLMDPREFEQRLTRARKLDRRYAEETGREWFKLEDAAHLRAGLDLVRTLERRQEEQAAGARTVQVARQLDQNIAAVRDKRARLKLLDKQVAELEGQRRRLEAETAVGERERLILLGQDTEPKFGADQSEIDGASLHEAVRERLRLEGRPAGDFTKLLDEFVSGEWRPTASASAVDPDTPPGVHPDSHARHLRILERQRETGESYVVALEAVGREEA